MSHAAQRVRDFRRIQRLFRAVRRDQRFQDRLAERGLFAGERGKLFVQKRAENVANIS